METQKHGAKYRRQWRKVHLGIGAQTLEIRAIEMTDNAMGDPTMLPELLNQIAPDEHIEAVSADGAYDIRKCHTAIASRGAMDIIPTRKNARLWKKNAPGGKPETTFSGPRSALAQTCGKNGAATTAGSLVETKMRSFKLLGERVMARTFKRQVVELQVRAAVFNRFCKLGRPVTVAVA